MSILRVCLCQLESHPAFYTGAVAYLEEPYVPHTGEGSLSRLGSRSIDVVALQDHCRQEYLAWSIARIRAVIAFIGALDPPPDLVLFPEGGVPIQGLSDLQTWSHVSGATILAGTHTPLSTAAASRCYETVGITRKRRKRELQAASVQPLVRAGKVVLLPKLVASPFEKTDVSATNDTPKNHPVHPITISAGTLRLLPLICIEALQYPTAKRPYDVVGVVSYDSHPQQFQPFIDQQVRNHKPVLYCNDGRFGGTRVGTIHDKRTPSWLLDTFPDGLPAGDAILVMDINMSVTAVEVGTSAPGTTSTLVALASVVGGASPFGAGSRELRAAAQVAAGATRAHCLHAISHSAQLDPLQLERLRYLETLERRGANTAVWWSALGSDCIIHSHDSLAALEGRLAATCCETLRKSLTAVATGDGDAARMFLEYYRQCDKRSNSGPQASPAPQQDTLPVVVDREDEIQKVASFLDGRTSVILEVTGLPQIGKSSALDKALVQSGVSSIHRLRLTSTSTHDYILFSLLKLGPAPPPPPYEDPQDLVNGTALKRALSRVTAVVFESAHNLTVGSGWRDEKLGATIGSLVGVAAELNLKLVFETQRELPFDLPDPTLRQRLHVAGLQKHLNRFGLSIFDAQLRRVGLSTNVLADDKKQEIVDKLGGHPVAIALAADACYEQGGHTVLRDLKRRRGFYLGFVRQLVKALDLTNEEQIVLRLLTLAECRCLVVRSSVLSIFPVPPPSAT